MMKEPVQTGTTPTPTASQGVDIQRNALQNTKGTTLTDQVNRLQKIAAGKLKQRMPVVEVDDNGNEVTKYKVVPVHVPASAMVAAEREIKDLLGHKAVEKIAIIQQTLLRSFSDLSPEDIAALEKAL